MDLPYRYVAFFSFIIFACFLCITSAADTTSWKTRSIYFAMTDRIARGENDNGGSACDNLRGYCGGTFRGLEKKLDYIRGMGFGAIWITPVVTSKLEINPQPNFVPRAEADSLVALFSQMLMGDIMDIGHKTYTRLTPTLEVTMT